MFSVIYETTDNISFLCSNIKMSAANAYDIQDYGAVTCAAANALNNNFR